jgi:hypothetical protein
MKPMNGDGGLQASAVAAGASIVTLRTCLSQSCKTKLYFCLMKYVLRHVREKNRQNNAKQLHCIYSEDGNK